MPEWSSSALGVAVLLTLCTVTATPALAGTNSGHGDPAAVERPADETVAETTETETANATETTETETTNATETTETETTDTAETETTDATGANETEASDDLAFLVTDFASPDSLRIGDRLEVSATVTNSGSENATGTLRYSFGGSTVASETVTLGPGASTTVEFDVAFSDVEAAVGSVDPTTYVHGVRNESGAGAARRLRVTPDVDFAVEEFEAPVEISHGEPYIVLATVRNPGTVSVTRNVSYEFAGERVARRAVTVAAGEDRQVAFEVRLTDLESEVGPVRNETTYDHGVVTGDHRRDGAVRVVRGPSANASALAVESFAVTDDVRPGEPYSVNLSVRNVDAADFEGQLSYRVDGAVVATEWVRVPVGERRSVTFRVGYDDVEDAAVPLSSPETEHGVFAGEGAVATRPVSVHVPSEPETTTRPAPTFTASPTPEDSPAPTPSTPSDGEDAPPDEECERGFFTACGGTPMDETSLTLFGVVLSGFGIVYQMYQDRR
jgi:hypothetical protein